MKRLFAWSLWIVGLIVASSAMVLAASANELIECPGTVAVTQTAGKTLSGWESWKSSENPQLSGVTFFDGHPRESAALVNTNEMTTKTEFSATWKFTPDKNGPIWIACSYSVTNISLVRALPKDVTECAVIYDPNISVAGLPAVKRVTCKTAG